MSCWATRRLYGIARLLTFGEASRPSIRESGLVGDAAGGRRRRDNELPVYDLGANRGRSPSAVCLLAFCAGGLRGAQHQHGDEREEKARADAEPVAAKPHREKDGKRSLASHRPPGSSSTPASPIFRRQAAVAVSTTGGSQRRGVAVPAKRDRFSPLCVRERVYRPK